MLKISIFNALAFTGMLIGTPFAFAIDQSEVNSTMGEIAKAYQANYLAQKALPGNATPLQRLRVQAQVFGAANAAVGKLQEDRFNEGQQIGTDMQNKLRKDFSDAMTELKGLGIDLDPKHQYSDDEKAAIRKKIADLIAEGKLVPRGPKKPSTKLAKMDAPSAPIKSKSAKKYDKRTDSKRDKGGEAGGADGAKAVLFKGAGEDSVQFRGSGAAPNPSGPAEVGGANAVQFGK